MDGGVESAGASVAGPAARGVPLAVRRVGVAERGVEIAGPRLLAQRDGHRALARPAHAVGADETRVAARPQTLARAALGRKKHASRAADGAVGAGHRVRALGTELIPRYAEAREAGGAGVAGVGLAFLAEGETGDRGRLRRATARRLDPHLGEDRGARASLGQKERDALVGGRRRDLRLHALPLRRAEGLGVVDAAVAVEVDADGLVGGRVDVGDAGEQDARRAALGGRLGDLRALIEERHAEVIDVPRGDGRDVPGVELPLAERVPAPVAERGIVHDVAVAVVAERREPERQRDPDRRALADSPFHSASPVRTRRPKTSEKPPLSWVSPMRSLIAGAVS